MFAKEIAFIVLFCVVGQQAFVSTVENGADFRGLSDRAEALLEKLREKLEVTIRDAEKKLNGLVEEVKQKGYEVIEKNMADMAKESTDLISEMEDIEREARELGLTVSFEEQKQQIKEIQEKLIASVVVCVTDKIEEFMQLVRNIADKIMSTMEFYAGLKERIKNCKSESNKFICFTKVVGEIIDKTLTLPVYVANQVAKAVILASSFVSDITACVAGNRLHFEEENSYVLSQARATILKHLN